MVLKRTCQLVSEQDADISRFRFGPVPKDMLLSRGERDAIEETLSEQVARYDASVMRGEESASQLIACL